MFVAPKACPNKKCKAKGKDFFVKSGYFTTKYNHQPAPRYKCLKCGCVFSSHSKRAVRGQKKPHINKHIFKWVCSGVPINRIAANLEINKITVMKKIAWLANEARKEHEKAIEAGTLSTGYAQFDELETFEHSRLKPLSIAVAVRPKTGQILGVDIATMNAKGTQAAKSRELYGLREDTRDEATLNVLKMVARVARKDFTLGCDGKPSYPKLIKRAIPHANIQAQVFDENAELDPLFGINHLFAAMRADLAPLARRSWNTTKKPQALLDLLWVYVAWVNQYDIVSLTR